MSELSLCIRSLGQIFEHTHTIITLQMRAEGVTRATDYQKTRVELGASVLKQQGYVYSACLHRACRFQFSFHPRVHNLSERFQLFICPRVRMSRVATHERHSAGSGSTAT